MANFKTNTNEEKEPKQPEQASIILPTETIHPDSYTKELNELENFFNTIELPTQEIRLNKHTKITDSNLFVKSHLYQAKTAFKATQRVFFLENLEQFKDIIYTLP